MPDPDQTAPPPDPDALPRAFDAATAETRISAAWEASGAFACDPASRAAPFTVMIPPPNVTGSLHVGHALTFTVQDALVRWRRMQGRDALWQPGTDHAGIATQMVVERLLGAEGRDRRAMGREAFLERVWDWKRESGGAITGQLRRLGASLDWSRERFTMDEGLSAAVRRTFVLLHGQGLLYRDRRLVNWDPVFQTAISDLEVESREVRGHLWHLRYPVEGEPGRFLTVATTRPETLLGDAAVAVHPDDPRYADLVGRTVRLPIVGRAIPVVADAYSDPEKGTGAVKITPAHDFNDFEVGRRHALPMPTVLDAEARVRLDEIAADGAAPDERAFLEGLAGLDRLEARARIVAFLDAAGLLDKVEPHLHQVPHGDRSGVPVEPRLTVQWYADAAALASPAVAAVETGRVRFVPAQWENTFFAWMRDIQPWCVSRQLWWGHRIPAWYGEAPGPDGFPEVYVAETEAEAAAQARARHGRDVPLRRDEDVLDTWFSSALWPFSTLGWPEAKPELARYYPTDVLVTGFDIIFFWVARMMMLGLHVMGEVPFRTVCIHGLVRDERGQKMSKSKGNVIDPLELVDAYGADALRFAICALAGPGRDVKLGRARVEGGRAFVTKLWNAARFCEMNGVRPDPGFDPAAVRTPLARWLLDAVDAATAEATAALEAFRLDEYAGACHRLAWGTFCDWFLEFAKPAFAGGDAREAAEARGAAQHALGAILRLLHPAMPFVTEALWGHFGYGAEGSLIRAPWPGRLAVTDAAEARGELDWVVRLVSEVRTVRAEANVPPASVVPLLLQGAAPATLARAARWEPTIRRLARVAGVAPLEGEAPRGVAQAVVDEATLMLPLAGLIDVDAERTRLGRERARVRAEADKVAAKLGKPDFLARAKPEVVDENRARLAAAEDEMTRLDAALRRLGT